MTHSVNSELQICINCEYCDTEVQKVVKQEVKTHYCLNLNICYIFYSKVTGIPDRVRCERAMEFIDDLKRGTCIEFTKIKKLKIKKKKIKT